MLKRFALVTVALIGLVSVDLSTSGQTPTTTSSWADPEFTSIQKTSETTASQNSSNFLTNLDCRLITFRYSGSTDMNSGCFAETAYGYMDADSGTVIFNDTDEGIRLLPYSSNDGLIPWPNSANVINLTAASTGGSYLMIYKNPFLSASDQRNLLGKLTSKKITQPADLVIRDADGNRITINAQTIAFSDGGAWLVAETLNGSFIRVNLASLQILPFAKSYVASGNPALLKTHLDITDDGRYVALFNREAGEFKVYDLHGCVGNIQTLSPLQCPNHDYYPKIRQKTGPIDYIRRVKFINQELISFDLSSPNLEANGKWLLAPKDKIDFTSEYLALGDSFSSGEGAYDYLLGTDSPDNMCHSSIRSYPSLIAKDLFSQSSAHSVACSGAVIRDVSSTSESYRGQAKNVLDFKGLKQSQPSLLETIFTNHLPGYIAQQRFVNYDRPRIITVSVGGNDIGFGRMLQACVVPNLKPGNSINCYASYEDQLEVEQLILRTRPKWKGLFDQLKSQSVGSDIYAIGYPSVSRIEGKCAANVHLSRTELHFVESTISLINDTIRQAAADSQIEFIDISNALIGHRLCEASPSQTALNGLTAGTDGGVLGIKLFGKESYHPNALGHRLIENYILAQTDNFRSKPKHTPADKISLVTGPRINRLVTKLLPVSDVTATTANKGSSINITYDRPQSLKPNAEFVVRLGSSTGTMLTKLLSGSDGNLNGTVNLPNDISGGQTIHIVGPDVVDSITDITQPIYIVNSDNDADGDGISNDLDSCPGAFNSNTDDDGNGVDDSCTGISDRGSNQVSQPVGSTANSRSSTHSSDRNQLVTAIRPSIKPVNQISRDSAQGTNQQPGREALTVLKPSQAVLSNTASRQILPTIAWKRYLIAFELVLISSLLVLFNFRKFRINHYL